jgi:hypothetical protein
MKATIVILVGAAAASVVLAAPANADDAWVNVPLTDDVATQLLAAGAVLTGRPVSEFGGLQEGRTYIAQQASGGEWAAAKLYANPGMMDAAINLQDQNSYMFFRKNGTPGSTWVPIAAGFGAIPSGEAPCPIPQAARTLWQWPQGKCYPPPQ